MRATLFALGACSRDHSPTANTNNRIDGEASPSPEGRPAPLEAIGPTADGTVYVRSDSRHGAIFPVSPHGTPDDWTPDVSMVRALEAGLGRFLATQDDCARALLAQNATHAYGLARYVGVVRGGERVIDAAYMCNARSLPDNPAEWPVLGFDTCETHVLYQPATRRYQFAGSTHGCPEGGTTR